MKILVLLALLCMAGCDANKRVNEFKAACDVFNEAIKANDKITADYVLLKLKQKVGLKSEVFFSWSALVSMPPDRQKKTRYNAFKSIAKEQLGMEWECLSMKNLADSFPPLENTPSSPTTN